MIGVLTMRGPDAFRRAWHFQTRTRCRHFHFSAIGESAGFFYYSGFGRWRGKHTPCGAAEGGRPGAAMDLEC
jgi:hypothetical protein